MQFQRLSSSATRLYIHFPAWQRYGKSRGRSLSRADGRHRSWMRLVSLRRWNIDNVRYSWPRNRARDWGRLHDTRGEEYLVSVMPRCGYLFCGRARKKSKGRDAILTRGIRRGDRDLSWLVSVFVLDCWFAAACEKLFGTIYQMRGSWVFVFSLAAVALCQVGTCNIWIYM